MRSEELAQQRLHILLEQVEEEFGKGWQSELARRTGLHQTTISKLRARSRGTNISAATLEKLARGLKIPRAFFFARQLGDRPDYRDYVGSQIETEDEHRAVVRDWLASDEARLVTPDQAERLLSIDWGGVEVTGRMIRFIWMEMDAEDRGKSTKPATENQAPTDLGNKRRIR